MLTAEQAGLAEKYLGIAKAEAWGFHSRSNGRMDLDSCMSAAMFGLVQGLDTYPAYCEKNHFDPSNEKGRSGYLRKRVRGAVLDAARTADHLSRTARKHVKEIRQAEDDGARTDAEIAAATGIDLAAVRRLQADAQMAVSLDDHHPDVVGEYAGDRMADHTEAGDVESQAVVSGMLGSFMGAFDALPAEIRVVLALRYHLELEVKDIAGRLQTSTARVTELHDAGVLAVHSALLRSVSG